MDSVSKNKFTEVISATSFKPKFTFFPKRSNLTLNTFINKVLLDRDCLFANRSQVKVYFYGTFKNNRVAPRCCTTNTIQQKKKIESKPSCQQSLKRALFKSQGEQIRFKSRLKTS